MIVNGHHYRTVWMEGTAGGGAVVKMINQPLIPHRFEIVDLLDHRATARAIKDMVVRGAGAIGAAAGFGMAQVALEAPADGWRAYLERGAETLRATRPTAQNLFYAVSRVLKAAMAASTLDEAREVAVGEAQAIADEDAAWCEAIGWRGVGLISRLAGEQDAADLLDPAASGVHILTHCNAGWLAFVDWGSALAPVYAAHRAGIEVFVWVDETRPRSQGARLTAWELQGEGVPHAIIADNAAGHLMQRGEVDMVIVGADRIAANGDVANKIGTYEKALCAQAHGVPFYVAAPTSTIDMDCASGDLIPIEERGEEEVLYAYGRDDRGELTRVRLAHEGARAHNPAFDVTPHSLVAAFITQRGVVAPDRLGELQTPADGALTAGVRPPSH
ncbi:MAG: S-methyl-5-thioribose-1-phosphate isomerase [Anaerolineae bacterium]|nr:S-methyl-5-thioribose-1-phosphate isomerase [Anaerolineae bacterium]